MQRSILLFWVLAIWIMVVTGLIWLIIQTPTRLLPSGVQIVSPQGTEPTKRFISVLKDNYFSLYPLCNIPADMKSGSEGIFNSTLWLIGVIAVFRHGDRGPLIEVPGSEKFNCSFFSTDNHKKMEEIIRRKQKVLDPKLGQPFSKFPSIQEGDHCKPGLLTKQGSSQLIKLGEILKKSYLPHLSCLGVNNSVCDNIEAISTPYSRTFQSLRSLLYGFLGPQFLNISISNGLNVAFCRKNCKCQSQNHYDDKFKEELWRTFAVNDYYTTAMKELSSTLGIPVRKNSKVQSSTIRDSFLSFLCHGEIPRHQNITRLASDFATYLSDEAKFSSSNLNLRKLCFLKAYSFLRSLVKQIQIWITKSSLSAGPKVMFFSGHDLTLLYILHALNLYDGKLPAYASRLVVEVLKDPFYEFYVRIIRDGNDVSSTFCGSNYCSWQTFSNFLTNEMWNLFKTYDIKEACGN